jgi:hypothetical protein
MHSILIYGRDGNLTLQKYITNALRKLYPQHQGDVVYYWSETTVWKDGKIVCTSPLFCTSLRLCLLGLMPQALQTGPWEPYLPPGRWCSSQNYWWGHGRETDDKCTLFWCCTSLRFCQVGLMPQAWQTVPWQPLYLMAEGRVPTGRPYQPDRAQAPWRGGGGPVSCVGDLVVGMSIADRCSRCG